MPGTQASDGVVVTTSGNLPTGHIIHMVGQAKEKDIASSMRRVLETCDRIQARSVSFPALGTGRHDGPRASRVQKARSAVIGWTPHAARSPSAGAGKLPASQMASAMIDVVSTFAQDKPKSFLATIHIVIFQPKMMSDFEQVMKKFKKVTPTQDSAGM